MTASAISLAVTAAASAGVPLAVIGAAALAVHGLQRSTVDLDLLATDERILWPRTWEAARRARVGIDVRHGDESDPLRGVVRIGPTAKVPVDIVVLDGAWPHRILARANAPHATRAVFGGVELAVARVSDILLLKIYAAAGDTIEDEDLILRHPDASRILDEVDLEIATLPRDCRNRWDRARPRLRARLG